MKRKAIYFTAILMGCSAQPFDVEAERSSVPLGAAQSAEDQVLLQSEADSEFDDLRAVADARGWTVEQARAQDAAAQAVGAVAEAIAARRPDVFIGSALAEDPGAPPTLYLKGPADEEVLSLVRAATLPIIVSDRHRFSLQEMAGRKDAVHEAILAAGYQNFTASADIREDGRIHLEVAREPGLPSTLEDIQQLVPPDLRDVTVISVSDEARGNDDTSFGGMLVSAGCTAGWSVVNELGVFGVASAGHCPTSATITHPPSTTHNLTFQFEHRGVWGDFEWYTSNVDEPAQFYATNTTIRTVTSVEAYANISLGESVCLYSRVQGVADCTSTVDNLLVGCTVSGVSNNNLVQMNQDIAIGGDSGAGWYFSQRAYGIHKGNCVAGKNVWTVAAKLPNIAMAIRL